MQLGDTNLAVEPNLTMALDYYNRSAQVPCVALAGVAAHAARSSDGRPDGLAALGFYYALGRVVPQSVPHSLVYHTFAGASREAVFVGSLTMQHRRTTPMRCACSGTDIYTDWESRATVSRRWWPMRRPRGLRSKRRARTPSLSPPHCPQAEFTGVGIIEQAVLIDEETQPVPDGESASEQDVIEYYRYHARRATRPLGDSWAPSTWRGAFVRWSEWPSHR